MCRSWRRPAGILVVAVAVLGRADGAPAADPPAEDKSSAVVVVRSVRPATTTAEARTFAVRYGLTYDDLGRLAKLDGVKHAVPLHVRPAAVRHAERQFSARLVGTTEDYARARRFEMAAGRFLKHAEDQPAKADGEKGRNVIVLGAAAAEALFPLGEAVGKSVTLANNQFKVIGVLKGRKSPKAQKGAEDFDGDVYIPLVTLRARLGEIHIVREQGARRAERVDLHQIILTATGPDKLKPLAEAVRESLKKHHERPDWEVADGGK